MKALKHINFCLFLLLAVLFTQNSIVRAAVNEKKLQTKAKEQKRLDNLKKQEIHHLLATSKKTISYSKDNINYTKDLERYLKPIDKPSINYAVKEKTFSGTSRLLSVVAGIWIFLSFIFSIISDKTPTQEKFPMFSFLIKKIAGFGKSTAQVKRPPASFLAKVADLLPKKHRESFKQEISDMRLEYYESLNEKKIWRARCIVVFYHIGLCWSVVMWISDKGKEVVGIIPKKN